MEWLGNFLIIPYWTLLASLILFIEHLYILRFLCSFQLLLICQIQYIIAYPNEFKMHFVHVTILEKCV